MRLGVFLCRLDGSPPWSSRLCPQYALAALHQTGRTAVEGPDVKAWALTQLAAQQGHAQAQHSLALMFEHGKGVAADMGQVRACIGGAAKVSIRALARVGPRWTAEPQWLSLSLLLS